MFGTRSHLGRNLPEGLSFPFTVLVISDTRGAVDETILRYALRCSVWALGHLVMWSEVGVQADGEPFCKDGEDADPGDGRGVGAQMF